VLLLQAEEFHVYPWKLHLVEQPDERIQLVQTALCSGRLAGVEYVCVQIHFVDRVQGSCRSR
jgi:phage FluMu protein gp41